MILELAVDAAKGIFGRRLCNSDNPIIGSQKLRRGLHHKLMEIAAETHERGIGTTFIMPGKRAAVNLGRSAKQDEYGRISFDVYRIRRFVLTANLGKNEKLLGADVYRDLMRLRVGGRLLDEGGCYSRFEKPCIDLSDIPDPRRVYINPVIISVSHPIGAPSYVGDRSSIVQCPPELG